MEESMKIILTSPPEIIRKNSGQELWHTSFQLYISPQDTTENDIAAILELCGTTGEPMPVDTENNSFVRDNSVIVATINVKPESDRVFNLEFSGVRSSGKIIRSGPVTTSIDNNNSKIKSAAFYVPSEQLDGFLPKPGEPAEWAGEGFYCDTVKVIQNNKFDAKVIISAREIITPKIITFTDAETHTGYDTLGIRRSDLKWKSIWSVPAGMISEFLPQCGDDASEWAGQQSFISNIKAEKKSDAEYLVTLEADSIFNSFPVGSLDDRSNLKSRVDIEAVYSDFYISPAEAGYCMLDDGSMTVYNFWSPDQCPIVTSNRISYYNRPLKTMLVAETRYYRGSTGEHLNLIAEWNDNNPIFSGKVGKYDAKWLKQDIKAENITDNQGDVWTRIERIYRHPPAGLQWNPKYWMWR